MHGFYPVCNSSAFIVVYPDLRLGKTLKDRDMFVFSWFGTFHFP